MIPGLMRLFTSTKMYYFTDLALGALQFVVLVKLGDPILSGPKHTESLTFDYVVGRTSRYNIFIYFIHI